jgi:hypothetical protein
VHLFIISPISFRAENNPDHKFIEDNVPFTMLLGKPWIDKDQTQRKEEEDLEKKKQELRDFMTKRIAHLLKEQEDQSKLLRARHRDVELERTKEDLRYLSVKESREPTPHREKVFPLNPSKDHQQCEVTMPREDQNQNRKRNIETKITGKKARSSITRKKR